MTLLEQLQLDIVAAMKARDEARLGPLRMMKSAMQKYAADNAKPLDETTTQQLLKSLVKQRIDAAEAFRKGGREDLAAKEDAEKLLIETYLPAAATDAEMDDAVTAAIAETGATSARQMGLVIKAAQSKLAGKNVDGKTLSEKVKTRLA